LNSDNEFCLIDSNFEGVISIYTDKEYSDKSISYIFIEEGIIMEINGKNSLLIKKKIVFEEAKFLWQKLLNAGYQKTSKKWWR